jgi:hypothetical protein
MCAGAHDGCDRGRQNACISPEEHIYNNPNDVVASESHHARPVTNDVDRYTDTQSLSVPDGVSGDKGLLRRSVGPGQQQTK